MLIPSFICFIFTLVKLSFLMLIELKSAQDHLSSKVLAAD